MLIASIFAAISAVAAPAQVPDLGASFKPGTLEVTAPPGHHFNVDAPYEAKLGGRKLDARIAPPALSVTLDATAAGKSVDTLTFVCDDAKTFCLRKKQAFAVPADFKAGPAAPSPAPAPKKAATGPAKPHLDAGTGFLVNDPERAFREAKARKLPLLIDFFGIWCPPCNDLDARVFKDPAFRKAADSRFVRLKLDADDGRFAALKARYRIQGLPTLVFATPKGDEIFRLVGFHPADEVAAKADLAYDGRAEGYADLSAKASGGNAEARYKAALIALDRDEPAKALAWLKPMQKLLVETSDPRRAELYRAQLGVAQARDGGEGRQEAKEILSRWVKEFPDAVSSLENHGLLAEIADEEKDAEARKAALTRGIALADKLLAEPARLAGSYFKPADVAQTRAGYVESLGDAAASRAAYLACADAYGKEAQAELGADTRGFARGPSLERAYCLGKAGKVEEADAIYREGIRRFPEEYTFHQGHARLWLEAGKDPAKAAAASELALKHAYGPQRLKSVVIRARSLALLGQKETAIRAIDSELAAPRPKPMSPGSARLLKKLQALKQELRSNAKPSQG